MRPEAASDVISGLIVGPIALNKHMVKFRYPNLNRSIYKELFYGTSTIKVISARMR